METAAADRPTAHLAQTDAHRWSVWRATLPGRVPGMPESPGPGLRLGRAGGLDHVQRVLLRRWIQGLHPTLDRRVVDDAPDLGTLFEAARWHPLAALPARRRRALTGGAVRLRPIVAADHDAVRASAVRVPGDVALVLAVAATRGDELVGLVTAYDEDTEARHCRVTFRRCTPARPAGGGEMVDGLLLLLAHLFRVRGCAKVYADVPEPDLPLVDGLVGAFLDVEGQLGDHHWRGGRHWDQFVVSLSRDTFERFAGAWQHV